MPRVADRFRDLTEAGRIEAELMDLQDAVRAYIIARDALDQELLSHDYAISDAPGVIVESHRQAYDRYEDLRTFI